MEIVALSGGGSFPCVVTGHKGGQGQSWERGLWSDPGGFVANSTL